MSVGCVRLIGCSVSLYLQKPQLKAVEEGEALKQNLSRNQQVSAVAGGQQ